MKVNHYYFVFLVVKISISRWQVAFAERFNDKLPLSTAASHLTNSQVCG